MDKETNFEKLYLEWKRSKLLGKMDSLLLSTGTILTISIYIIEFIIQEGPQITYLLSLFLLLFVIPIWKGYVNGAIRFVSIDYQIIGRVRGWIFFMGGLFGYFFFLFLPKTLFPLVIDSMYHLPISWWIILLITLIIAIVLLIPIVVFIRKIGEKILSFIYYRLQRPKVVELIK